MSDYVSNLDTSDGIKKIKDSEARKSIEKCNTLIRSLQSTPLPAFFPEDMKRTDRVYIYLGQHPDYEYGYIYYYDDEVGEFVKGWQYQTFQEGTYGVNPCYISLISEGFNYSENTVAFKGVVYAFQKRIEINANFERPAEGTVSYMWVNLDGSYNVTETLNIDKTGKSLIAYLSHFSCAPVSPVNVIIDGVTFNQSPVKETEFYSVAQGSVIELVENENDYTVNFTGTVITPSYIRENITFSTDFERDIMNYLYYDYINNTFKIETVNKNYTGCLLLAYFKNMSITYIGNFTVKKRYIESAASLITNTATITAGLTKFADASPVTGIQERNYIDLANGIFNIDFLRIWNTNNNIFVIQDTQLNFTVNNSFHIFFYDTWDNSIDEVTTAVNANNSERWIWLCTCIPGMNYFKTQFDNIKVISNNNGYYSLNKEIAIFGDSIATGTVNVQITNTLKNVFGINCYNGAVGSSGFLAGNATYDKSTSSASTHESGQFTLDRGIEVTYPAGASYSIGARVENFLPDLIAKGITHVYIHNGNNDIMKNEPLDNFWTNFNPQTDSDYVNNILADTILDVTHLLESYGIHVTHMLPIGRLFTSNGNIIRNGSYIGRRRKYIKVMEKLSEYYDLDIMRTDKMFNAPVIRSAETLPLQSTRVREFLGSDGLHPTTYGYSLIAAAIANNYYNRNKCIDYMFH